MFSQYDIQKELGKGINIVPFHPQNIKENSVNLSAGSYAWTMTSGQFRWNRKEAKILSVDDGESGKVISLEKGDSCVVEAGKKSYIVLLPFSTTLIETEEVLAIDNYLGGTYHSKVGLVSKGTGHIGTMVGPNFSGHSLVAVHNISNAPLKIMVGDTFVSVIFYRLETPIEEKNPTIGGHLEKFAELGIKLDEEGRSYLSEDWKSDVNEVREKMRQDIQFKKFEQNMKDKKRKRILSYINKKTFFILGTFIFSMVLLYCMAMYADSKISNPIWVDRYWSVGFSGIFIAILGMLEKLLKPGKH